MCALIGDLSLRENERTREREREKTKSVLHENWRECGREEKL